VDVEAADELRVEALTQLLTQSLVARERDERLPLTAGERMRACSDRVRADAVRSLRDLASQQLQLGEDLVGVPADRCGRLDEAGEELRLQPLVRLGTT
jgi:hypothetical protein